MSTVTSLKESFGFIAPDSSPEEMFFMPKSCRGFGHMLPPIGTRVSYEVVQDEKTGRPRAENIYPEAGGDGAAGALLGTGTTGTISATGAKFGFIMQDHDSSKMFILPMSCTAFGGCIPPVGTRVFYDVVEDGKTGRPRAENVQPMDSSGLVMALGAPALAKGGPSHPKTPRPSSARSVPAMAALPWSGAKGGQAPPSAWEFEEERCGVICQQGDKFGFILQDSGEKMFVMPAACASFGSVIPPEGTRVTFKVVMDGKTGRPRAEDVQDEGRSGVISQTGEKYGFILQDSGESMFVMPAACASFGSVIPPEGTRVTFRVVPDGKTGRPRAEDVQPEPVMAPRWSGKGDGKSLGKDMDEERAGVIFQSGEKYGFILQDSGEKMFVMPAACTSFGSVIPPEGTRVTFHIVPDGKTGRPRAEDVQPEPVLAARRFGKGDGQKGMDGRSAPY
ncbi:unnamed protein product [Effrenium voratum]|nr:unnamed protein product [Effrenium voratum]